MFPFIWWLGGSAAGDGAQHEGGDDFLRRRVLMATSALSRRGGAPANYVAWFYAAEQYMTVVDGLVAEWRERGPGGGILNASIEAERPTWEASGGWSASKSSIVFNGGKNLGSGPLAAFPSGTDVPYWVVATAQVTDYTTDRCIASWDDVTTAQSEHFLSQTDGFMGLTRTDDAAGSATATATGGGAGTGHRRLGWSFTGTTVNAWVDLNQVLSGAACNVGLSNYTRLRIGDGIIGADSLVGRITEFIVGVGELSQADWQRYYYYSIGEWG